MASIVLSSIGSSVGNALLPGVGGRILSSVGRRLGAPLDEAIGWSEGGEVRDGARLENFKVQDSRYGLAIPLTFGAVRVAGNVIWVSELIETAHQENVGGGKGGGSLGGGASRTTYSYSLHAAIALGEGPIGGVRTIWADNKVIYQDGVWKAGVVGSATVYKGTQTQEVDPLMESCLGSGEVPAYRGLAYVVLESLQLAGFGNRLPNLTFEVLPEAAAEPPHVTGAIDPALMSIGTGVRGGGMMPVVVDASSAQVRRLVSGGYEGEGNPMRFVMREVDVSEDTPSEIARTVSADFTCEYPGGMAMAADGAARFIAVAVQNNDAGKTLFVALYDVQRRVFGAVRSFAMGGAEDKQVVWLDEVRFAVMDKQGGLRGVRCFMRSGVDIVDLGFTDVFGAATSRFPIGFMQFLPVAGGVMCLAGDASPRFTRLYARYLYWKGSAPVLGAVMQVGGTASLGTGGSPQFQMVRTGEGEWTALWMTASELSLATFLFTQGAVQTVRPWTTVPFGAAGVVACVAGIVRGEQIDFIRRAAFAPSFDVLSVPLLAGAFGALSARREITGTLNAPYAFCALKIGGGRVLADGCGSDGYFHAQALLAIDRPRCEMGDVVARLLARAGYAAQEIDVSALAGIYLDGFVIADGDSLTASLQWLQAFEPFDLIERSGKLVAQRRNGAVVAEISDDALGAGKEGAVALEMTRVRELALPVELTIDTIEAARDYEIGTQRARRLIAAGGARRMRVALPLVCGASAAKRVAERMLYNLWGERVRFAFSLPYPFGWLEVGDVVRVRGHRARIVRMERTGFVWEVEAVSALADGVQSAAQGESARANGVLAGQDTGACRLYLMDLPPLRAGDDGAGFYVAVSGGQGWKGAGLWRSPDGVNFTQKGVFDVAATAGCVVEVPVQKPPYYKDMESVLKVQLYQGQLESVTASALLAGANVALCGGEILQFETATLVGPQLYELRGLLRGRLGTEAALATHSVGEDFVLLTPQAVQFVSCGVEDRGRDYHYRAVTAGATLGFAQNVVMRTELKSLRPLAPAQVRGVRSGGDLTLGWVRRARVNGGWCDFVDVPLDETQELYDVEIIKDGAVVRSFGDVMEPRVVYSAAQQVADFGAAQAAVRVRVYQKSLRYGRGEMVEEVV